MSLLDVFKDFEYEDDDDHSTFFQDNFSQLLDESDESRLAPVEDEILNVLPLAEKVKAKVEDFEEAFTVLKSIESAHEPLSCTSINAFLHHKRNIQMNKRTVEGLAWPEHPESFKDNRLICNAPIFDPEKTKKRIPNLVFKIGETEEGSGAGDEFESESDEDEDEESVGSCKMTQSNNLHKSLLRTIHSIYHHKSTAAVTTTAVTTTAAATTVAPPPFLDPRLAHSIARRTALLLQSVFIRSSLNRQSALRVLKQFHLVKETADVDNVASNWETIKMAAEQLIGQAALDQETFDNFSSRLDGTLK